jgi:hypothetical protein
MIGLTHNAVEPTWQPDNDAPVIEIVPRKEKPSPTQAWTDKVDLGLTAVIQPGKKRY